MRRSPSDEPTPQNPLCRRVVLLDDHVLIRQAMSRVLRDFDVTEIFETSTGEEFLRLCRLHQPDLGIIDLMLPDNSAIPTIKEVAATMPEVKILVVSAAAHQSAFDEAVAAGALGYLHKSGEVHLLNTAIETVLSGGRFFGRLPASRETPTHLSPRELDVLRLVAEGCSTKEVASRLEITVGTADHYRTKLMRKLHLHDVVALTRYALRNGIATLD